MFQVSNSKFQDYSPTLNLEPGTWNLLHFPIQNHRFNQVGAE